MNSTASQVDFWESVGQLWTRATGGSDVAARPTAEDDGWPTGARPPGVSQAIEWFSSQLSQPGLPKFLFLIGGPGAGKSHASAELVAGLSELNPRSEKLAYRTYEYATVRRNLLLINDATIQSEVHGAAALSLDIDDVVRNGCDLLACINRGVLVEELSASRSHPAGSGGAGREVVEWLHGQLGSQLTASTNAWAIETDADEPYLRAGRIYRDDDQIAQILAIYVDVCSLFEPSPLVKIDQIDTGEFDLVAEDYTIQEFHQRTSPNAEATPASSLFEGVLARIGAPLIESELERFDPIAANLRSLASPRVQKGIQAVLRGAEIASSQRLTYRELWGAIARCVVGDATDHVNADGIAQYVASIRPRSSKPLTRFKEFQLLARLRFSQAIVGADSEIDGQTSLVRNPVTRLTKSIDPVRDAIPGVYSGEIDSGWATPISDAFAGHVDSGSLLEQLIRSLPQDSGFVESVGAFDHELDLAFTEMTRSPDLKDSDRYPLIAWYGGYLMRLYAISEGIPAFRREISVWTLAWFMSPTLPRDLEAQLRTLLKPPRFPEKGNYDSLIPVFESRTNPIVGDAQSPKLALRAGIIGMRTRTNSDSLLLELEEVGRAIPPIILDFPLMREALACGSGHSGITEVSDVTSPRLERFRAARLVPGSHLDVDNYRVVNGISDEPLNVGGR
ncbi:MAG: hypothetical protein ACYCZY_01175 [Lacisediminihabitans sp.]